MVGMPRRTQTGGRHPATASSANTATSVMCASPSPPFVIGGAELEGFLGAGAGRVSPGVR